MRRRRLGFGAELAPLVLILACLAGSLGLIVAAYRRVNQTRTLAPRTPIVAAAPAPVPTPPRPVAPRVATPPPRLVVVDVPPPPPPEDPTPKALAQLTASEAEQLLAASQANRKAQALDEARQVAAVESERWRRRQSLIHAQVSTLETKVRKVETDLDALAFERDALEKELDARKAAVARAKSRPSQAILPHKGPNGTWRRPVIVECRNGAAVIQPQGMEFGLLDLESGFGATLNPFVAAVAREAIRVQRSASPDGAPVVPYIFFLVRPDGIRPYYEARGRLEPLGITFGYELADAEWEIEFPDLDDVAAWDGSASSGGPNPALASNPPGRGPKSTAEDTDLPTWPGPRGNGNGKGNGPIGDPSRPFGPAGGGDSRSTSIMGRAFDGPITPTSNSRRAGLNGPGSGGSEPGSNPAPPDGGSGDGNSANPGPAPAGFPAALLASGGGTKRDGSAQDQGEDSKPALPGGDSPAGPGKSRVTASGRVVAGGARLGSGLSSDPGTKGGSGQPGGSFGLGRNQADGKTDAAGDGKPTRPATEAPPIELALDGPTADPGAGTSPTDRSQTAGRGGLSGRPEPSTASRQGPPTELALNGPIGEEPGELPPLGRPKPDTADPASTFVWPGGPDGDGRKRPKAVGPADDSPSLPATNADRESQVAVGADPSIPSTGVGGPARPGGDPGGVGGNQAAQRMLGQPANQSGQPAAATSADSVPPPPGAMGIGLNAPVPPRPLPSPSTLPSIPPPGAIPPVPPMNFPIPRHLPTPSEAAAAVRRQTNAPPNLADWTPQGSVTDKTFEIVVVCGPEGVTVQPGNYRVTVDALKDREGLFKKQVVALVKNRRAIDPKTQVEPRVRFLIQPQGFDTYRLARSQFFVSGLIWPTSTQVAAPDPLVIRSRGIW